MGRITQTVFLLVVIAGIGGYWYHTTQSACRIPLAYGIGEIDPRFSLSLGEVRTAVSDAESLWEDATGKNIFTYIADAEFTVNFIFDDRQEVTNEEHILRDTLDQKEGVSESIQEEYEQLVFVYEDLRAEYDLRVAQYEVELDAHNKEVERWNDRGGAPREIFEGLNSRQQELAEKHQALNSVSYELNQLVRDINALGEAGNDAVRQYNENVSTYNDRFDHDREFTQGDYQGDHINIYQFDDPAELRLVLAHELGHALSLGHVDDAESVMYYLMEGQLAEPELSRADVDEFERVCGID